MSCKTSVRTEQKFGFLEQVMNGIKVKSVGIVGAPRVIGIIFLSTTNSVLSKVEEFLIKTVICC